MEKYNIDSRGIRQRRYNSPEHRRKRVREEKEPPFYKAVIIRIVLCILIGGIGTAAISSNSEKAVQLKSDLNQALSKNISFDDLKELGKDIKNAKDKGLTELGIGNNIEIESDYIDEMNSKEEYYQNQKK